MRPVAFGEAFVSVALAANTPKVQQGDNARQLKWHQAHQNFYDPHPDYKPPKHRLGPFITTKS
jgi:hypothetical protein